ncbi:MAG: amidohydrolase [Candidatus Eremiobacteraeota bacterium]|nr:amidohydrolase [Candidatus Eremiobacteraeota bacterium]
MSRPKSALVLQSILEAQPPRAEDLEPVLAQRLSEVMELRWDLHRHPCLSGDEQDSADRVKGWLQSRVEPTEIVDNLGETGLAVVLDSGKPGSTVLLRAELDALPMDDLAELPHRSIRPGIAHKCGHDGHTAIVSAAGLLLHQFPLPAGRAILLYQPAEETGCGARQVLADPRFAKLGANWAFGLHNVPGLPVGQIQYRVGSLCPASEGLEIKIVGAPSHASEPQKGRNPALALSQMIGNFAALPTELGGLNSTGLITPTHIQMGDKDFGISPGEAVACFTVRAETNRKLQDLVEAIRARAGLIGSSYGLQMEFSRHDPFSATVNTPEGTEVLHRAFHHLDYPTEGMEAIFPWSEDFGEFLMRVPGAFFALGAGLDCPPLHSYEYDFPDQLIAKGALALYTAAWIAATSKRV